MSQPISPEDIVLVKNIDVDCNDVTTETVRQKQKIFDEQTGKFRTIERDVTFTWNHSDGFQVLYGGFVQKIAPGETRPMARYIAQHYAKHLTDHIMQKRGKGGLLNDKNERNKIMAEIIVKVESYMQPVELDDNLVIANKTDNMDDNYFEPVPQPENITEVPETESFTSTTTPDIEQAVKPEPTIGDLRSECKTLGIEIKNTDTKEILTNKIKQFAGI